MSMCAVCFFDGRHLEDQLSDACRELRDYKDEAKYLRRYQSLIRELLIWDEQGRPWQSGQLDRVIEMARDVDAKF